MIKRLIGRVFWFLILTFFYKRYCTGIEGIRETIVTVETDAQILQRRLDELATTQCSSSGSPVGER